MSTPNMATCTLQSHMENMYKYNKEPLSIYLFNTFEFVVKKHYI